MKLQRLLVCGMAASLLAGGKLLATDGGTTHAATTAATTTYVPEGAHQTPLPDGVLAWDGLAKTTDVVATAGDAHFVFNFTNVTHGTVTIREVQPSCGCTTAQLPPLPWSIPPGTHGQIGFKVHLLGKARKQVKTVDVETDRGSMRLTLGMNILPPMIPAQSKANRVRAMELTKADRQAIFRGGCVTCHVKPDEKMEDGRTLYYAACASCHEGRDRSATMPDLFAIKTPTDVDFWLNWIAHGKPGTLMPAFSTAEGGPLSEMQIAYLARFLNTTDEMDAP